MTAKPNMLTSSRRHMNSDLWDLFPSGRCGAVDLCWATDHKNLWLCSACGASVRAFVWLRPFARAGKGRDSLCWCTLAGPYVTTARCWWLIIMPKLFQLFPKLLQGDDMCCVELSGSYRRCVFLFQLKLNKIPLHCKFKQTGWICRQFKL